ncbi:MAG: hypothetical protein COV66_08130 [Nitrospinae bacterium CG11_big_fil_rev_8_21_14_0_20_45_15]|nr:MAG: hypothetical protein COV66_08130 [Nitrospinae bacterium CG11_big_fil_rev_8_21_14_0_20_45_15]
MFLNIENKAIESFNRHFLEGVHCEIEFSEVTSETLINNEEAFKREFNRIGFASFKKIKENSFAIEATGESGNIITSVNQQGKFKGYLWESADPKRNVQINLTQLLTSDYSYSGFDNFHSNLNAELKIIEELLGKRTVKKIGLKKVNKIQISSVQSVEDIGILFNSNLLGGVRSGIGEIEDTVFTEEKLVFKKEQIVAILTISLSKIKENVFGVKLELDCICLSEFDSIDKVNETLSKINQFQYNLFNWSITEDFIKILRSSDDESINIS